MCVCTMCVTSWNQYINNIRGVDDHSIAESKEELKSLLRQVKVESERAGLKLNIKKNNNNN